MLFIGDGADYKSKIEINKALAEQAFALGGYILREGFGVLLEVYEMQPGMSSEVYC